MIKHIYGIEELDLWLEEEELTKSKKEFMKKYGFVAYHNNNIYIECDCSRYGGIID